MSRWAAPVAGPQALGVRSGDPGHGCGGCHRQWDTDGGNMPLEDVKILEAVYSEAE